MSWQRRLRKTEPKQFCRSFTQEDSQIQKILRGRQPVSPSAIKAEYPKDAEKPRELSETEIEEIILAFGQATKRAIIAGFDGVELHGANTYLLQQFYSGNANQRTDKWGGSLDARLSFPLAVLAEVTKTIKAYAQPSFILGYRLSPEEIEPCGIRLADSLYFAETIKNHIDYLHLSMASYQRTSLNDQTDQRPILAQFAKVIDQEIPLIGIGSVELPADAEAVLASGGDWS